VTDARTENPFASHNLVTVIAKDLRDGGSDQ
jgi:hypothetical protein